MDQRQLLSRIEDITVEDDFEGDAIPSNLAEVSFGHLGFVDAEQWIANGQPLLRAGHSARQRHRAARSSNVKRGANSSSSSRAYTS